MLLSVWKGFWLAQGPPEAFPHLFSPRHPHRRRPGRCGARRESRHVPHQDGQPGHRRCGTPARPVTLSRIAVHFVHAVHSFPLFHHEHACLSSPEIQRPLHALHLPVLRRKAPLHALCRCLRAVPASLRRPLRPRIRLRLPQDPPATTSPNIRPLPVMPGLTRHLPPSCRALTGHLKTGHPKPSPPSSTASQSPPTSNPTSSASSPTLNSNICNLNTSQP